MYSSNITIKCSNIASDRKLNISEAHLMEDYYTIR